MFAIKYLFDCNKDLGFRGGGGRSYDEQNETDTGFGSEKCE